MDIANYYRFNSYSLNSSGVMYNVAKMTHKNDNDMLWFAIVGLTDQFVHDKINRDQYITQILSFQDEVTNPYRSKTNLADGRSLSRHCPNNGACYDYREPHVAESTILKHRQQGHIQPDTEYQFELLKFWTLYDSMKYSRYFATKLEILMDKSENYLKNKLVKMGIPLLVELLLLVRCMICNCVFICFGFRLLSSNNNNKNRKLHSDSKT